MHAVFLVNSPDAHGPPARKRPQSWNIYRDIPQRHIKFIALINIIDLFLHLF